MATDDATVVARPHSAEDLDEVFDALAHRYRRTIIEELEWGEPQSLDSLAALIADGDELTADVRIALVHNHLPRLTKANVITYDADEQLVELDDPVAERAVLTAVRGSD